MSREYPRNLFAASAVLLLHAALIAALIAAMQRPATLPQARFVEVLVRVPPRVEMFHRSAPELLRLPSAPEVAAPQISIEPGEPATPSSSAIIGIGRALFGCDIDKLASLPPEQRAGCLHLPLGHPQEPSVRLGPYDENSPFAQVIARRNAPVVPFEHACAPNEKINSNLGLPCYGFPRGPISGLLGGKQ